MSRQNLEVVQHLIDAVLRLDVRAALDYLDLDLEWIPHRAATEGTFHGHEGFERWAADTQETFELFEPHFELEDLGDQVLAWGTRHSPGSRQRSRDGRPAGGIFDFRDGRITRWKDFGCKQKAVEAVGRRSRRWG